MRNDDSSGEPAYACGRFLLSNIAGDEFPMIRAIIFMKDMPKKVSYDAGEYRCGYSVSVAGLFGLSICGRDTSRT